MSKSEFQKCNQINAHLDQTPLATDGNASNGVASALAQSTSNTRRRGMEVAMLIAILVLLAFQGMTFSFVKRVDERLQAIIQRNGFGSAAESRSDENQKPRFTVGRRSLSIEH